MCSMSRSLKHVHGIPLVEEGHACAGPLWSQRFSFGLSSHCLSSFRGVNSPGLLETTYPTDELSLTLTRHTIRLKEYHCTRYPRSATAISTYIRLTHRYYTSYTAASRGCLSPNGETERAACRACCACSSARWGSRRSRERRCP